MLAQPKHSEISLLVMVSLMSFVANLPNQLSGPLIDKRLLLIALTVSVLIALLRHLRALLSLSIGILAIGANLPESLAASLGVSPMVMTVSLATVVVVILMNKAFKLLPSEINSNQADTRNNPLQRSKIDTKETRLAILMAICKGDHYKLNRMLDMNVEVNFSLDGLVPILIAADRGYSDITLALIRHGADFRVRNKDGKTAFEIALAKKDNSTAEILYNEIKKEVSRSERFAIVDQFFRHQKSQNAA